MIFFQQRRNFHLQLLHNRIAVPPKMQNLQPWETILMGMVKVKKVWKADYSRVLIPQELPKFVGTHHPSLEVTKTWNNREPQKVLKGGRTYFGIQYQHCSFNHISKLHPQNCHLATCHTPPNVSFPLFYDFIHLKSGFQNLFFHQNNFGFL